MAGGASDPPAITMIGATARLFAFIGDPVAQGKLPGRLNRFLVENQVNAIMVPMQVAADRAVALFDSLAAVGNYAGAIVTIPHKAAAYGWAPQRSQRADACGVANILYRGADDLWTADNLDGLGMLGALQAAGFEPAGSSALVLGCGGAGAAIAATLAENGIERLKLHDVNADKADDLKARLTNFFPNTKIEASPTSTGCNLVVNATPLGMADEDPLVRDPARFEPGTVVADAVARHDGTRFLTEAGRHGHPTADGIAMVEHQMTHVCRLFKLPVWPS